MTARRAAIVADWLRSDPDLPDSVLAERLRTETPLAAGSVDAVVAVGRRRRAGGELVDGLLGGVLDDPAVTDVLVNGPGAVWVDRGDGCRATDVEVTADDLEVMIDRLLDPIGRRVDRASPLVDARLPDGSRVNVVVAPIALDGPVVSIRRFAARAHPLESFGPPDIVDELRGLLAARANVVVSGATGAGKTSLLNALTAELPSSERLVVLEDTAELRLPGAQAVRLEARPANSEGTGEVTLGDLVVNALRMRPDRLVVGEVRGGEALHLVLALNTGHDGCLATCHANDAAAALRRLEALCLLSGLGLSLDAVRAQLDGAIDAVVHIQRTPDGRRQVRQILRPGLR
ncbi:MAG: CpaF family protein [Acidimicrobiales bacterium]